MKKLYVFDFDGVIADTGDDIAAAVMAAQRHFKACKVRGKKNILSFVGYGAEYLIEHTVTGAGNGDAAKLKEVVAWYKEYYYEHCADKSKLYSGVEDMLKALKAKGAFVCMFTNKPKRVTERSLKIFGIYDLFDHIFCPEDLCERKPSPEGIIKCMEACGVSAEDTLMVGDSAADIVAAKAAGVSSCGVLCGLGDREKMQAEGPDFTVYFASEVLKEKPCAETVKKSPKKTKKKGNVHKTIFFAIQLAGYFFCGGFFANEYGELFSKSILSSLIMLFLMFFAVIVLSLLSIIVHEAGHLVFGLLSGYEFSSFRIGSITLVRSNGKFSLKRFNIPGTGGQCLMKPPAYSENLPVIAYNLGGGLLNIIFGAAAAVLALIATPHSTLFVLSAMFSALNISLGISNIYPFNPGMATDGYNLRVVIKNSDEKYALWLQLYFMAFLAEGGRLDALPEAVTTVPANIDYGSHLQAVGAPLLRFAHLESLGQYEEALLQVEEIINKGNLVPLQKIDLQMEQLLLTAITSKDREKVTRLRTKELQAYAATMKKYSVGCQAMQAALSFLWKDESDESLWPKGVLPLEKQLAEFERVAKRYPYEGETENYRKMVEELMK